MIPLRAATCGGALEYKSVCEVLHAGQSYSSFTVICPKQFHTINLTAETKIETYFSLMKDRISLVFKCL